MRRASRMKRLAQRRACLSGRFHSGFLQVGPEGVEPSTLPSSGACSAAELRAIPGRKPTSLACRASILSHWKHISGSTSGANRAGRAVPEFSSPGFQPGATPSQLPATEPRQKKPGVFALTPGLGASPTQGRASHTHWIGKEPRMRCINIASRKVRFAMSAKRLPRWSPKAATSPKTPAI